MKDRSQRRLEKVNEGDSEGEKDRNEGNEPEFTRHADERQVSLDVDRSFIIYPPGEPSS